MKVQFTVVSEQSDDFYRHLDVIPRVGENVSLPWEGYDEGKEFTVRRVGHYPFGDEDDRTPFVYVVLGGPPL